jgi:type I restriction enzyme R subunit
MQQALADGVLRPPHEPSRWGEPVAQEVHEPAGVYQVPATSASTRGESTWLAILRSAAGDAGFEAVAAERWADEARRVQGVVQDALQEHSLNPRDIEAAVRQALLPRLFALMGLERARAAIDQMIRAAGVGPPHRHVEAATDRR